MKVYIIAAISSDSYISNKKSNQRDWTSEEDKLFFKEITTSSRVVVMGNTTFRKIGHMLPGRLNIVYTKQSLISDQKGLQYTQDNPKKLVGKLETQGFSEVAIIGGKQIYEMFLNSGLVTDVYLTVEPEILGSGLSLADDDRWLSNFKLKKFTKLNDYTTLSHYKSIKK